MTHVVFMRLKVNGEDLETTRTTVMGLIEELGITPERVAVEVNQVVIKKRHYHTSALREGDSVEIVNFVGGG